MNDIRRVDWFRILVQLQRAGHPLILVATSTGITEGALRGYLAGMEPAHWRGEALLLYWSEVTGKTKDSAPLKRSPFAHL